VTKCFSEISEKNEKIKVYSKPSEMLNIIESYMRVLLSIENYGMIFNLFLIFDI